MLGVMQCGSSYAQATTMPEAPVDTVANAIRVAKILKLSHYPRSRNVDGLGRGFYFRPGQPDQG